MSQNMEEKKIKSRTDDGREISVIIPSDVNSDYINTFSIGFSKTEFILEFGNFVNDNTVKLLSKVKFSPLLLKQLIDGLIEVGHAFEEENGEKLDLFSDKQK